MKKEEKKTMLDDILLDPSLILFSVLLICVYYGLFSYLGIQTEEGNKNIIVILIEIVLWSSFIFLVLIKNQRGVIQPWSLQCGAIELSDKVRNLFKF